jgi:hypothetical protein
MRLIALLMAFFFASSAANAADESNCKAGLICASKPETVVKALLDEGYRAKLDKDKTGEPMISSQASGYDFDIYFYGCEKAINCSSLQFQTTFSAEFDNTPAYSNAWNAKKRFIQASVEDQKLSLAYDLTTIGGLNAENFADVVDWWSMMLGEFSVFVKEQDDARQKK